MSSVLIGKPGDLLQFQKTTYTHWAVLVCDKYIIHVQAPEGGKQGHIIIGKMKLADYLESHPVTINLIFRTETDVQREISMHASKASSIETINKYGGCWASVNNSFDKVKKPFNADEIIERAESMVGKEWDYDLFKNNCEHFAHWCRYGIKMCGQSPNITEYKDEEGNGYGCAQLWGPNVGPVSFKFLGLNCAHESKAGRNEYRANGELASFGVSNLARASVGAAGKFGGYADDNGLGFKAEAKYVEADVGPVNAKIGLSASTGIDTQDGLKTEVLGTGFDLNSQRLEVKFLGSSVGISNPFKSWF